MEFDPEAKAALPIATAKKALETASTPTAVELDPVAWVPSVLPSLPSPPIAMLLLPVASLSAPIATLPCWLA
ncbi:MAG TPA: hypothetical protein VFR60_06105, partial [Sphingomicrobium sp.]|nr:hypothetical protein [Sphingomicrobium sp.]